MTEIPQLSTPLSEEAAPHLGVPPANIKATGRRWGSGASLCGEILQDTRSQCAIIDHDNRLLTLHILAQDVWQAAQDDGFPTSNTGQDVASPTVGSPSIWVKLSPCCFLPKLEQRCSLVGKEFGVSLDNPVLHQLAVTSEVMLFGSWGVFIGVITC